MVQLACLLPVHSMLLVPSRSSWFQHVSRGVAVAASTGAAVVSIVTALYSYGVLGRSESHQSIGNVGAAWVRLRPAADTATAIGDTVHFAATIADRKGSILIGASPVWTTGDASVATVSSDGSVTARGPGATTVSVVVGSIVANARVVVSQRVATVNIEHPPADSTATLLEGAQVQLRATPLDARGHRVAGRLPAWRSDDSAVATVDAHGLLTGLNAGRGMVSVTVDGVTDRRPVAVAMTVAGLAAVAGNDQHALAGHSLAQRVVIRATNRKGAPAAGKLVTFRLNGSQGKLDPATVATDADGRARTQWTLGDAPGRQELLAGVESLDSTVVVMAEAAPVAANTRVVALAGSLRAPAGSVLSDSVAVRVTDSAGRPLGGIPVRWEVAKGGVEPIVPRTDSLGVARVRWTLGALSGTQRLQAFVGSAESRIAPTVLVASALAGPPARVVLTGGDRQVAAAGAVLTQPVVVHVVDASGNGAAGVPVALSPSAGTLRDSALVTDSLGFVRTRWTMGHSAGVQTLAIRVQGLEKPLRVVAHATPARAANLSFDDAASPRGASRTDKRLVALVADVYGNPIADAPVSFSTKSGAVAPARAVTDAHGRVAVRWTLARTTTDQRLAGTVRGTSVTGAYLAGQVMQAGAPATPVKPRKGTR